MRMFTGVTSMVFAAAAMSAGCATGDGNTAGAMDKGVPMASAGAADAMIYINGLSCPF